jgi:hypothetical protein
MQPKEEVDRRQLSLLVLIFLESLSETYLIGLNCSGNASSNLSHENGNEMTKKRKGEVSAAQLRR